MKKGLGIFIGVIVLIFVIFALSWSSVYNTLITKSENINKQESEINNQLQRRADLIPNLVSTVKGLTTQEQSLVNSVTDARAKMATGSMQDKLNASDNLTKNLNIIVENYPILKSDTAFTGLMDELAGTENRIAVARKAYNDEIASYNTIVKTFPSNIVAGMSGFDNKPYLETSAENKEVPNVQF